MSTARRRRRQTAFEHSSKGRPRPVVTVVEEADVAWALAEAAKPHLSAVERNNVYVAIGVGETFAAVHYLIKSAAGKRIALSPEIVQQCQTWLDVYVGHHDEPYLRGLIECVLAPYAIRPRQKHR